MATAAVATATVATVAAASAASITVEPTRSAVWSQRFFFYAETAEYLSLARAAYDITRSEHKTILFLCIYCVLFIIR